MPVPSHVYDSCFHFVWFILAFYFAIWLVTFRFKFSPEFSIFVIFYFFYTQQKIALARFGITFFNFFLLFFFFFYAISHGHKFSFSIVRFQHHRLLLMTLRASELSIYHCLFLMIIPASDVSYYTHSILDAYLLTKCHYSYWLCKIIIKKSPGISSSSSITRNNTLN